MATRVLNFDNVEPSGHLHDIVKGLFYVLLLYIYILLR